MPLLNDFVLHSKLGQHLLILGILYFNDKKSGHLLPNLTFRGLSQIYPTWFADAKSAYTFDNTGVGLPLTISREVLL